MMHLLRSTARVAGVVVVAALVGCSSDDGASAPESTAAPAPIRGLFEVDGRETFLQCEGVGSPTVVLEGGLGIGVSTWSEVLDELTAITRVCVYDRPGIGNSEAREEGASPSFGDAAADLHTLLEAAAVPPPYVVGGFSAGGIIARAFAAQHPDDVVGVVLIDSAIETQWEEQFFVELGAVEEGGVLYDLDRSVQELAGATLGDLPLQVVTQGDGQDNEEFWALWSVYQQQLVDLSSQGRQVIAEGSGHDIPHEAPAYVIDAVRAVVEAVRG